MATNPFGYDGTTWSYARKPSASLRRTGAESAALRDVFGGRRSLTRTGADSAALRDVFGKIGRNTRGGNVNRTPGTQGAPGVVVDTLTPSTETIVENEKLRSAWRRALEFAAKSNATQAARARLGASASIQGALRNAVGRSEALREQLSAEGLGYSPRFAGRGQRAIAEQTAADVANIDADYRNTLANLAANLQANKMSAADELSNAEIDALTEAGRRSLQELLTSGIFNTKGKKS